jgi:hypothetical protein
MSQVTIQGNAAGTGIFTVAAPNSNTSRTLTLPDESGTVLTDAKLATQAEAQAGSDNTKVMTPLRVSEAIVGRPVNYQVFTASGTWTKPAGVKFIIVEVIQGGESGSASGFTTGTRSGGNGGIMGSRFFFESEVPASVTVTVGAGGTAVSSVNTQSVAGNPGGHSSFGTLFQSSLLSSGLRAGSGQSITWSGTSTQIYTPGVAGSANLAGSGGAANWAAAGPITATAGNAPGGGGGAALLGGTTTTPGTATSGAGARGEVRVWAW